MKPAFIAIGIVGAVLVALSLPVAGPILIFPVVVPALAPVLPRPEFVPRDASSTYDWKASGQYWHWRRSLPHGCAKWRADKDSVFVFLFADARDCEGRYALSYYSGSDELVMQQGTPISGRTRPESGGEPCAFAVSGPVKAKYQQLIAEAGGTVNTVGETRTLRRMTDRLAAADGDNLLSFSNGEGCDDAKPEDYKPRTTRRARFDPLENRWIPPPQFDPATNRWR